MGRLPYSFSDNIRIHNPILIFKQKNNMNFDESFNLNIKIRQ